MECGGVAKLTPEDPHWKAIEGTVVVFSRVTVMPPSVQHFSCCHGFQWRKMVAFTLSCESVHVFSVHINPDWKQNTYIYYIMNPSNSHITPTWMPAGS